MNKSIFIFCLFFYSKILFSQNEVYNYARKIVDTMASESMHGRGYVNSGDKIAANYIKTEFEKFGLKTFNNNYYQHFNFDINTFPNTPYLSTDYISINWFPAENYLVSATSPPIKKLKNLEIVWCDSTTICSENNFKHFQKQKFKNKWIIIDKKGIVDKEILKTLEYIKTNPYKAHGIGVIQENKLTWTCSQNVSSFPTIELLVNDSTRKLIDKTKKCYVAYQAESKFIPNYQSQNVIGYVQGSIYPDSFFVFSAHYDHLGQMGENIYFPGANDNASGCAMLLNLAKYYSKPENKPKYSILFIAFGAEEVGLVGSKYFTENPLVPLNKIKFVLNMDIMGTGEEGITVVNGSIFKNEFDKLKQINTDNNYIKEIKIRGKAANSDHYYFSEKGVKAFFIYTMGGIKAYHDIYDKAETLPLNEFENLFKLITKFSESLQN